MGKPKKKDIAIVVRLGGVGDVIMAEPTCRALKEQGYTVYFETMGDYAPVASMLPSVDKVLFGNDYRTLHVIGSLQKGKLKPYRKPKRPVDMCGRLVDLTGAIEYDVNALIKTGVEAFAERADVDLKGDLKPCLIKLEMDDDKVLSKDKPNVILHVGAGDESRSLSPAVAQSIADRLVGLGAHVIVIGLENALTLTRQKVLSSNITGDGITNLTDKVSTLGMLALISRADFYVGTDSGPSHIAGAYDIPSVVFYTIIPSALRAKAYPSIYPVDLGCEKSPCVRVTQKCPDTKCSRDVDIEAAWKAISHAYGQRKDITTLTHADASEWPVRPDVELRSVEILDAKTKQPRIDFDSENYELRIVATWAKWQLGTEIMFRLYQPDGRLSSESLWKHTGSRLSLYSTLKVIPAAPGEWTVAVFANGHIFHTQKIIVTGVGGDKKFYEPGLSIFIIAKNEAGTIKRCIQSILPIADEVILLDTGSTDRTKKIARKTDKRVKVFDSVKYTKETNADAGSGFFDFAEAKNEALSHCARSWAFWMDADDVLEKGHKAVKDYATKAPHAAAFLKVQYGDTSFAHLRMFRQGLGIRFKDPVHEYVELAGHSAGTIHGAVIQHIPEGDSCRDSLVRNEAILRKAVAADPTNTRRLFYLGNTLREGGNVIQAIGCYQEYLKAGGWDEERFYAQLNLARCYFMLNQFDAALSEGLKSLGEGPQFAEGYCLIGDVLFAKGEYEKARAWFERAASVRRPSTAMLFIHERLYAGLPEERIKECDKHGRKVIVRRPGAIGDCLVSTAALSQMKKFRPCWIEYVCGAQAAQILEGCPYIDKLTVTEDWADVKPDIDFQYPVYDDYPRKPMTRHLVEYFCKDAGVPSRGAKSHIELSREDNAFAQQVCGGLDKQMITLHARAGWSQNKWWPDERWSEIVDWLADAFSVVEIGSEKDEPVSDKTIHLMGKTTIKQAAALVKYAFIHMGVDSWTNHATYALNTLGVILFGSTSPIGSGYLHNENLWAQEACSKAPCYRELEDVCQAHECMNAISVDEVKSAITRQVRCMELLSANVGEIKLGKMYVGKPRTKTGSQVSVIS